MREALPDFGLDNLLNRGDIAVRRTANGLGESFFGLARYLPSKKVLEKSVSFLLTNECWKLFSENYEES